MAFRIAAAISDVLFVPAISRWPLPPPSAPFTTPRFMAVRPLQCQKMFAPGFGAASPEARAAQNLKDFFTYLAVNIVLAQLESYNPEAHAELMEFIDRHSLNDGENFCQMLMRESWRHKSLALRILEVRSAYCKRDFEWDNLKKLAIMMIEESKTRLLVDYLEETSHLEETTSHD